MSPIPKKVTIIGVGGIGIPLAEGLARILEHQDPDSMLVLIDGDHFEQKNTERQAFRSFGNKATVKANEMTPHFPRTFIAPIPKWVVPTIEGVAADDDGEASDTKIAVADIMADGDIVFAVVDNFAARALILDHARTLANIDVFIGGNDDAFSGWTYHYERRDGAEVIDHPVEFNPELADPADRNPGQLSCQERAELVGGAQFVATNATVAAVLLGRFTHCVINDVPDGQAEIQFDLARGEMGFFDRRVGFDPVPGEGALVADLR